MIKSRCALGLTYVNHHLSCPCFLFVCLRATPSSARGLVLAGLGDLSLLLHLLFLI